MNEKLGHVIKLDAEDSAFVLYKALVKEILNGDIMQYILVNIVWHIHNLQTKFRVE